MFVNLFTKKGQNFSILIYIRMSRLGTYYGGLPEEMLIEKGETRRTIPVSWNDPLDEYMRDTLRDRSADPVLFESDMTNKKDSQQILNLHYEGTRGTAEPMHPEIEEGFNSGILDKSKDPRGTSNELDYDELRRQAEYRASFTRWSEGDEGLAISERMLTPNDIHSIQRVARAADKRRLEPNFYNLNPVAFQRHATYDGGRKESKLHQQRTTHTGADAEDMAASRRAFQTYMDGQSSLVSRFGEDQNKKVAKIGRSRGNQTAAGGDKVFTDWQSKEDQQRKRNLDSQARRALTAMMDAAAMADKNWQSTDDKRTTYAARIMENVGGMIPDEKVAASGLQHTSEEDRVAAANVIISRDIHNVVQSLPKNTGGAQMDRVDASRALARTMQGAMKKTKMDVEQPKVVAMANAITAGKTKTYGDNLTAEEAFTGAPGTARLPEELVKAKHWVKQTTDVKRNVESYKNKGKVADRPLGGKRQEKINPEAYRAEILDSQIRSMGMDEYSGRSHAAGSHINPEIYAGDELGVPRRKLMTAKQSKYLRAEHTEDADVNDMSDFTSR
jgi:hypothetical protein